MGDAVRHVPAALCEIEAGRSALGFAYASLVVGSEVMSTSRALTVGAAVDRERRRARAFVIGEVRISR